MGKTISSFRDLEQYGICALTGEACGYSMRILCDVNEVGKLHIERFLGVTVTAKNWNTTVNRAPAINSVMLPHHILQPLAAFLLLEGGYELVYEMKDGCVYGVFTGDIEKTESLPANHHFVQAIQRVYRGMKHTVPNSGGRIEHVATGRLS